MGRRLRPLILAIVAATVALVGSAAAQLAGPAQAGAQAAGAMSPGWSDPSLDVVGGPVVGGSPVNPYLLLFNVTSAHVLHLTAISPTGQELWTKPSSSSGITAGVAYAPVSVGAVVLNLAPVGPVVDSLVQIEGLNIGTGKVVWKIPEDVFVTDAPVACLDGVGFCVAIAISGTASALIAIDSTGAVFAAERGPYRSMEVPQPGTPGAGTQSSLWETESSPPTLVQVSSGVQVLWRRSVAAEFGSTGYNPNYGWDFIQEQGLDVGSIANRSQALDLPRTIGINAATGELKWRIAGDFQCGGPLSFLTPAVVCQYSGAGGFSASALSKVQVVIKGLDIVSGHTTWAMRIGDPKNLLLGTDAPVLDDDDFVVHRPSGALSVLDAATGATRAPAPGEVFWCMDFPFYKIVAGPGEGQRVSEPVFSTCSANGKAAPGVPLTRPNAVGVDAGGLFVWPTVHGLRAVPTRQAEDAPSIAGALG